MTCSEMQGMQRRERGDGSRRKLYAVTQFLKARGWCAERAVFIYGEPYHRIRRDPIAPANGKDEKKTSSWQRAACFLYSANLPTALVLAPALRPACRARPGDRPRRSPFSPAGRHALLLIGCPEKPTRSPRNP